MANANLDLLHWAFYADDNADPDSCTIIGSEDVAISRGTGTGNRFMVRLLLNETADKNDSGALQLEYELNNSGTWNSVDGSTSSVARVTGGTPADAAACDANILTAPSGKSFPGDWFDGEYDEGDGATGSLTVNKSDYTECQWCVYLIDADVSKGDIVKFRHNGGAALDSTWTTEAELSVIKPGTISREPSDALTLTESLQRDGVFTRALADALTLTDNLTYSIPTPGTTVSATLSDVLTLVDTLVRTGIWTRGPADVLALTETLKAPGEFDRALSDGLTLTESLLRDGLFVRRLTDTVTLAESLTHNWELDRSLSDAFSVTENLDYTATGMAPGPGFHHRYWLWRALRRSKPYQGIAQLWG